ncbi:HD-GYP domain-containing protein [Desulfitobacterium sp.]|uniref:HD-GYP domain-containing protein n=1 Tax=Desulfitobacterium sp. TaxID=49981 RepID=UPI002B63B3B9|nr:HD-GYP domain-containing protein [Desulfitobacterium sp.]HVJ50057.1 HD-GYP domain-containing protein [Desulfitobacterium sp.]
MNLVLERVSPDTVLNKTTCEDLFDSKGTLLLEKGHQITASIRKRINNREVYVLQTHRVLIHRTKNIKGLPKDTYVNLVGSSWSIYHEARMIEAEQIEKTVELVEQILNELSGQDIRLDFDEGRVDLRRFKKYDYELFEHVINVALLSALIGMRLGYENKELSDLTLGALLHDLGKLRVPQEILYKPACLTEEEFAIMKQHPLAGEELLKNARLLPRSVLAIIKEHHERWNGLGYPYGLKGNDIHRDAQIVAVADVFEALTADRPYRKGLPPYHALEMIIADSGKDFNRKVVQALQESLTLYPENTKITLNTGEIGVVIAVPVQMPTRPLIRLLFDREGRRLNLDTYVDLMQNLTGFIERVEFEEVRCEVESGIGSWGKDFGLAKV